MRRWKLAALGFYLMYLAVCATVLVFCATIIAKGQEPRTYDKVREPQNSLQRRAMETIGHDLLRDPIMSVDGTMTCAVCHIPDPKFDYSDGLKVAVGRRGSVVAVGQIAGGRGIARFGLSGIRRTLTLDNCADHDGKPSDWDGRGWGIYDTCLQAVTDDRVMGYPSIQACVNAINGKKKYVDLSAIAFGTLGMTEHDLRSAFVVYLRTLRTTDTPAHRLYAAYKERNKQGWSAQGPVYYGERPADYEKILDQRMEQNKAEYLQKEVGTPPSVTRGFLLVLRDCSHCHDPEQNWRSYDFYRSGLVERTAVLQSINGQPVARDRLRGGATRNPADDYKSMPPSLINVARRPPYGYNGSIPDLKTAVTYFCSGGRFRTPDGQWYADSQRDAEIASIDMTAAERDDVLAFLTLGTQSEDIP